MTERVTDAELEAQFLERNANLKNSLNTVVDKIDKVATKTQDFLQEKATENTPDSHLATSADQSLMNEIQKEVSNMHSTDPEVSKDVYTKTDETFAQNALP